MNPDELSQALAEFTGSVSYHQLYPKLILTDGGLFLAQHAGCFWLMDLYFSYLIGIDGDREPFTCLKMTKKGSEAKVSIDDGNGKVLAEQDIEWTDFPLESMRLFGCWTEHY